MVATPSELSSRVALSLGAVAAVAVAYKLLVAKPAMPPGAHAPQRAPDAHWLLGDLPALVRNATRFNDWVLDTTRACGERTWLRRGPLLPDMVIVAAPAVVEDVTRTQHDAFGKGDFTRDTLFELLGDSFFSLDGPAWLHQRKTATKFFSARMYREVATPVTSRHVANVLAKLAKAQKDGTALNWTSTLSAFALQNFAQLGFGLDIEQVDPAPLDHAFDEAFVCIFKRMQRPVWFWKLQKWLNVGNEREYREIVGFIRAFVATLVRDSLARSAEKAGGTAKKDAAAEATTMVELFIHAMRSGDSEITPELLSDIAIMFVLAGRDTTSDTLNWLFYCLSKNPRVEQRIRQELWENVPTLMDGSVDAISMEQAQTLLFLEAAIKETMRLYPVSTISPREALRDAVLCDGTFVPKGMSMGISAYAMGRLTSVWGSDAAQYNPDRFLDEATGKLAPVSPFKFYGFGAGPRNCIGMHLAMLEMKMLVAAVFSRFRLEMAPNDGGYKFSATLTIAQPLVATVHAAPGRT